MLNAITMMPISPWLFDLESDADIIQMEMLPWITYKIHAFFHICRKIKKGRASFFDPAFNICY
jgi:hypothetical protein